MNCYLNPTSQAAVNAAITAHRDRIAELRDTRDIRHTQISLSNQARAAIATVQALGHKFHIGGAL